MAYVSYVLDQLRDCVYYMCMYNRTKPRLYAILDRYRETIPSITIARWKTRANTYNVTENTLNIPVSLESFSFEIASCCIFHMQMLLLLRCTGTTCSAVTDKNSQHVNFVYGFPEIS